MGVPKRLTEMQMKFAQLLVDKTKAEKKLKQNVPLKQVMKKIVLALLLQN
jgi:hypothetical protein